jgi:hypothetical protein
MRRTALLTRLAAGGEEEQCGRCDAPFRLGQIRYHLLAPTAGGAVVCDPCLEFWKNKAELVLQSAFDSFMALKKKAPNA